MMKLRLSEATGMDTKRRWMNYICEWFKNLPRSFIIFAITMFFVELIAEVLIRIKGY